MLTRILAALPLLCISTVALAAADLRTTMTGPTSPGVYTSGHYEVTVANIGNQNAASANLTIQLPTTQSSPTNKILGILGAKSAACSVSGTTLTCALGAINKNKSKTVFFDIALPYSSAPLTITATVTGDNSPGNNTATRTPSLTFVAVDVDASGGPLLVDHAHCTGTGLTSYFVCTLFPSSISTHTAELHDDGSITFPGQDLDYHGTWSQPDGTTLEFSYFYGVDLIATFSGRGVDANCFEGMTTFHPPSPYNSGYEVCLP